MRPVKRSETVEILVAANATSTRFPFGDIPQLRSDVEKDIWIRGIEAYCVDTMPNDFNNNVPPTLAQIQVASLTCYIQGAESVFRIPLQEIVNIFQEATINPTAWVKEKFQADNWEVDWTKSYVSVPAPLGVFTAFAWVFRFEYYKLPPGTMNTIKKIYGIPDEFDIPPGLPMPNLKFGGNNLVPGSMQ